MPEEIVGRMDYVVPIPNSGLYYAMGLAEQIKVPYLQSLVKPDTLTRSFQISDIALREHVIRQKITPIRELLEDKNIMLRFPRLSAVMCAGSMYSLKEGCCHGMWGRTWLHILKWMECSFSHMTGLKKRIGNWGKSVRTALENNCKKGWASGNIR